MIRLGFDVGGSSIKGAAVNVSSGELVRPPVSIETPKPATPMAVADAIAGADLAVGCEWPYRRRGPERGQGRSHVDRSQHR